MKTLLLSSAFAIVAFTSSSFAEERKVGFAVSELTCPSCSFIVASAMQGVPSVRIDAFVEGPEYGQGIYSVTFDDARTSVESIIEAVTANGYPVRVLPDPAS